MQVKQVRLNLIDLIGHIQSLTVLGCSRYNFNFSFSKESLKIAYNFAIIRITSLISRCTCISLSCALTKTPYIYLYL